MLFLFLLIRWPTETGHLLTDVAFVFFEHMYYIPTIVPPVHPKPKQKQKNMKNIQSDSDSDTPEEITLSTTKQHHHQLSTKKQESEKQIKLKRRQLNERNITQKQLKMNIVKLDESILEAADEESEERYVNSLFPYAQLCVRYNT